MRQRLIASVAVIAAALVMAFGFGAPRAVAAAMPVPGVATPDATVSKVHARRYHRRWHRRHYRRRHVYFGVPRFYRRHYYYGPRYYGRSYYPYRRHWRRHGGFGIYLRF